MIDQIYIEEEIKNHRRAISIIDKLRPQRVIVIEKYSQLFNRKNQNFLLQKEKPSLILAKKYGKFFHKIKTDDTIGREENYYFSNVLNCPFSCKYCFLQGIYRSSNFVIFINFEDFQKEIEKKINESNKKPCFFAGYDSDTLATNHLSNFIEDFYPFFQRNKKALFEIRTKSTNIDPLVTKEPITNLVIAFSLNPKRVIQKIELKTPSLESRLLAIKKLQKLNFQIGLRFDPIIYFEGFEKEYEKFFEEVFKMIDRTKIHSITLGTIRFPFKYFENMKKNNIYLNFLASIKAKTKNRMSYTNAQHIIDFCRSKISKYMVKEKMFIHNA